MQTEIDHREKVITHTDNFTDKQLDHVHHETKAQSAEGKQQNSEVMKTGEIPVKRSGKAAKEEVTRILKGEIWNFFFVYERHFDKVDRMDTEGETTCMQLCKLMV